MPVDFVRPELLSLLPRYTLIDDCISGEKAVKKKRDLYLPIPNKTDKSQENLQRYEDYILRAVLYGVTGRTLRGMVGEVFRRDPVITLPDSMSMLEQDADGGGLSLDQLARKALSNVLAFGRVGMLVDYPKTSGPATKADMAKGDIQPTITLYDAWSVINWRVDMIGAKKKLTLVVIRDMMRVDDDGFEQKFEQIYRVLLLDPQSGNYVMQTWMLSDANSNVYEMDEVVTPLDANGQPWKEIPFMFIGSENNDPSPDLPPMYDMAELNIAHYRNSADYEEAVYIMGQPTPWFAGLTDGWIKEVFKGKIQLGSRTAVPLPDGASAGMLQAESNTMVKEAMDTKERQMVALGARLVEQQQVQRTATEASLEESGTVSVLGMAAKNVSHGFTQGLKWCAMFLGVPVPDETTEANDAATDEGKKDDICYELSTEFDDYELDPLEIQQLVSAWQAGAISLTELRDNLRRGGIAYQSDDDFKNELESAPPNLGLPPVLPPVPGAKKSTLPPPAKKGQAAT